MRGAWRFAMRERRGGGTTFRRGGSLHNKRCVKVSSSDAAELFAIPRSAREKFGDVIPEIDIWRAATLMLKRYGEIALQEARRAPTSSHRPAMTTAWRFGAAVGLRVDSFPGSYGPAIRAGEAPEQSNGAIPPRPFIRV